MWQNSSINHTHTVKNISYYITLERNILLMDPLNIKHTAQIGRTKILTVLVTWGGHHLSYALETPTSLHGEDEVDLEI